MKRRDILEENHRDTEYFFEANESGKEISQDEYEASSFYGLVNIYMKQYTEKYDRNMSYPILAARSAYSTHAVKQFVSLGYSADHRGANFKFVISIAFILRLEVEKTNKLLEAADMARLKPQKVERGDDIILNYYNQLLEDISKIEKEMKHWNSSQLLECETVKKMNEDLNSRGIMMELFY